MSRTGTLRTCPTTTCRTGIFDAPALPQQPRDSSAAAIAACGLFDLYIATGDERYLQGVITTLTSLAAVYTSKGLNEDGILLHATGVMTANRDVDVSITYADYYFVEALLRLLRPRLAQTALEIGLVFPTESHLT